MFMWRVREKDRERDHFDLLWFIGGFYTSTMIATNGWSNLAKSLKQSFRPPQKVRMNSKLNVSLDDERLTQWDAIVLEFTKTSKIFLDIHETKNLQFITMFWKILVFLLSPNSKVPFTH